MTLGTVKNLWKINCSYCYGLVYTPQTLQFDLVLAQVQHGVSDEINEELVRPISEHEIKIIASF